MRASLSIRKAQAIAHSRPSKSRRIKMAAPTRPVGLTPGFEEMSMSDVEGVTSVTRPPRVRSTPWLNVSSRTPTAKAVERQRSRNRSYASFMIPVRLRSGARPKVREAWPAAREDRDRSGKRWSHYPCTTPWMSQFLLFFNTGVESWSLSRPEASPVSSYSHRWLRHKDVSPSRRLWHHGLVVNDEGSCRCQRFELWAEVSPSGITHRLRAAPLGVLGTGAGNGEEGSG